MAVWGIGAMWNNTQQVAKDFIQNQTAAIGWNRDDNPKYHQKMDRVCPGDLIFIKARYRPDVPLRIKGIGIVLDACLCEQNGFDGHEGIRVRWIRDFTDTPVDLDVPATEGSCSTFYQEDIPQTIAKIINLI